MHGKVATLTLNEALTVFRSYGIPMSQETLTAWIDSGAVPWAVSARRGGAGPYLRKIFRKPLVEWLESMVDDEISDEQAAAV